MEKVIFTRRIGHVIGTKVSFREEKKLTGSMAKNIEHKAEAMRTKYQDLARL
jgi:hypothetical protein